MTFFTIISRSLIRRPVRTALTLVGISIGIAAVVALVGMAWGYEKSVGKQLDVIGIDAIVSNISGGVGLMFAETYINSMTEHYRLRPGEVGAFVVARYFGTGLALDDVIWSKYGLGQMWKVIDPTTKEPSTRNLFYRSKPGDMPNIDASVDRLITKGVVIGVCGHAISVLANATAARAGVSPEAAMAEWRAHVIPGVHVVPSGVLAVAKAQEAGCTYCFGG